MSRSKALAAADADLAWIGTAPRTPNEHDALTPSLSVSVGAGIIYTTTVKTAERLWAELCERGVEGGVGRYHGDLPTAVRNATQNAFMDGRYRVIIATKAFGMGIDKRNVRFVVHYEMPDSLESYIQEAARAGRDGLPARAVLLYRIEDKRIHELFIAQKYPRAATVTAIASALAKAEGKGMTVAEIAAASGASKRKVEGVLRSMTRSGLVAVDGSGFVCNDATKTVATVDAIVASSNEQREADRGRLSSMRRYAESTADAWTKIDTYFSGGSDGTAS